MGFICPLFLNPFTPNYVKRGEHTWAQYLRSMFKLIAVVAHVETVCLLSKLHEAKHHINVKVDTTREVDYGVSYC